MIPKGDDDMEEIIQQWKKEALGIRSIYKDTTVYHIDGNKLYLITKYPGLFIGYHGRLVNKYQEKLGMEVEMIELHDGITRF